jgi:hypothetical protein
MYIGIDVSKATLDVAARPTGDTGRFGTRPPAFDRWCPGSGDDVCLLWSWNRQEVWNALRPTH